ncbi:MAG: hypothetical protein AAGD10_16100 [Myxococcota bacterium]
MFALLTLPLALAAAVEDAPTKIFTESGVEIRLQEEVFQLFAALNAAGYSEESERRAPPLSAPVYHELRVEVRDALRELRDQPVTDEVRKLFEANPYPVEDYLAAMVAGPGDRISDNAKKLRSRLGPLEKFAEAASLTALFDRLAEAQRALAKGLSTEIETGLGRAGEVIADPKFRAPTSMVVIPNPLDSHDAYRSFEIGTERFVVVGPGLSSGRDRIVYTAVEPYIRAVVDRNWGVASKWRTHWDGVKLSKRILRRYKDGKNYMTVALARALVHRIGGEEEEADDIFVDEQAREGMRWARIANRVWAKAEPGVPFARQARGLVTKYGP